MANGKLFYEGESVLDGQPIIGVVTHGSHNKKTGKLAQTWIMRSDIKPSDALRSGDDVSVCGDCIHRITGSCYVAVFRAPATIYAAYHRGSYPRLDHMISRPVRIGSYGDPAAIPEDVWTNIIADGTMHTGYTHQWRQDRFAYLNEYCMASCETPEDVKLANSLGFRSFRTIVEDEPSLNGEITCMYETNQVQCATCGLCSGRAAKTKLNISIQVHGLKYRIDRYKEWRQQDT